jgi:hypothetical protein
MVATIIKLAGQEAISVTTNDIGDKKDIRQ